MPTFPPHRDVETRLGEHIVLNGTISDILRSSASISLGIPSRPFIDARVRVGFRDASVMRPLRSASPSCSPSRFSYGFGERVRP